MAERVLQQTVTVPAGTPLAAPVTVGLAFNDWEVEAVDLEVPPGPAGTMGFVLANNGQAWLPRVAGEWLVWDDRLERFYVTGYPVAGGWQIIGWNVGKLPHNVIVRFHVNAGTPPTSDGGQVALTFITSEVPARRPVTL